MNYNIPPTRSYRQSHPLALWLSATATVLGFLLLVAPVLGNDSPTLSVLPTWGIAVWGANFFLGGVFATYGLWNGARKLEGAGMALQASAWGSAFVSACVSPASSVLGILFLLGATGGTTHRAYSLGRDSN